ncbi:MAG: ATP-binding cassette domain-containing protein [Calditrichaeota bacterium]|nr:ATP-binding cassette domain-containing protein [Calditrichota bacterium]
MAGLLYLPRIFVYHVENLKDKNKNKDATDELLEEAIEKMPSELSGGMRKRAALARALALDPPLILCDEPSAGLDPVTSQQLDSLLLNLRDNLGLTIVIVTHEIASIMRVADRIAYLEKGEIIFDGSLEEALRTDVQSVHDFFEVGIVEDSVKSRD